MTRTSASRSFMVDDAADEAVAELYRLLGEMMVIWNQCEGRLRRLVVRLAGGKHPQDFALTANTSAEGLLEILNTFARYAEEETREHLVHYIACVDRLREHHNFFARGTDFVGDGGSMPGARAWVSQLAGGKRLRVRHDRIGVVPLRALVTDLTAVSAYGRALLAKLSPADGTTRAAGRRWPQKPPLPDRLGKPAPVLMGEPPLPGPAMGASEAVHTPPPPLRPRVG